MNNGDQPASPSDFNFINQLGKNIHEMNTGLTKREAFAMAAMQGMSSHPDFYGNSKDYADVISKSCVLLADAMLNALED